MRSIKKISILIIILLILAGVVFVIPWYKEFKQKSRESYVYNVAKIIHNAELSYKEEFGTFSESLEEVGVSLNIVNVTVYMRADQMPESEREKIDRGYYPSVSDEAYRIVFKYVDKDNRETFWLLEQDGILKRLKGNSTSE